MAGLISKQFIDQLLTTSNIVDVIDAAVPLKKRGANYVACCPFHQEKTPSFTVNEEKQFYHCFGCGESGSAINFLMDFNHLTFPQAINTLADKTGLTVQYENPNAINQPAAKQNLKPLYEKNQQVKQFYQQQLKQHLTGPAAIQYLTTRGLSASTIETFNLGLAPPGWSTLRSSPVNDNPDMLHNLGLLITTEKNTTYDRFRDRIIFPITNKYGQTIGFGGGAIKGGAIKGGAIKKHQNHPNHSNDSPKYLNSPETPLYHKGREVYGLHQALNAQQKPGSSPHKLKQLVLVEGYTDVLSLHQHGINNAVAALGTAITYEQINLLFNCAPQIIICLDADRAGQEATQRAMKTALPALKDGRSIKIINLPPNQDPDSLVNKDLSKMQELITTAIPLSTHFFNQQKNKHNLNTIEGRAECLEECWPLLKTIPPGTFAKMMVKNLENITETEDIGEMVQPTNVTRLKTKTTRAPNSKKKPSAIRHLAISLIHNPQLAQQINLNDNWLTLNIPGMDVLKQIVSTINESHNMTTGMLLERFRSHPNEKIITALFLKEKIPTNQQEINAAIERLKEQQQEKQWEQLLTKTNPWTNQQTKEIEKLIEQKQKISPSP